MPYTTDSLLRNQRQIDLLSKASPLYQQTTNLDRQKGMANASSTKEVDTGSMGADSLAQGSNTINNMIMFRQQAQAQLAEVEKEKSKINRQAPIIDYSSPEAFRRSMAESGQQSGLDQMNDIESLWRAKVQERQYQPQEQQPQFSPMQGSGIKTPGGDWEYTGKEWEQVKPTYTTEPEPNYSPKSGVGTLSKEEQWKFTEDGWKQVGQPTILNAPTGITTHFGEESSADVYSDGINWGTDIQAQEGTQVALPEGQWQILDAYDRATRPGFIYNNDNGGYGNSVLARNMETGEMIRYSHLAPKSVAVSPGDIVDGGQIVALTGNTGNSTGPHLDLEYRDPTGQLADIETSRYADALFNSGMEDMAQEQNNGFSLVKQAQAADYDPDVTQVKNVNVSVGNNSVGEDPMSIYLRAQENGMISPQPDDQFRKETMVQYPDYPDYENEANNYDNIFIDYTPAQIENAKQYVPTVEKNSKKYDVPADLLLAQMRQENNFKSSGCSNAGACGISQFIPATAVSYGLVELNKEQMAEFKRLAALPDKGFQQANNYVGRLISNGQAIDNRDNTDMSIEAQAKYMKDLLKQYGSIERALSAYNSGKPDAYLDPGFSNGQTYNYVRNIMNYLK